MCGMGKGVLKVPKSSARSSIFDQVFSTQINTNVNRLFGQNAGGKMLKPYLK